MKHTNRFVFIIILIMLTTITTRAQPAQINKSTMINATINSVGELEVTASRTSSQADFDFYVGNWKVHNRKLKTRLSNCNEWIEFDATAEMQKILNGHGNTDNFLTSFDGTPFEGRTLRLFNPKTRLWSIYWADSNGAPMDPPVVGSFENSIGTFYSKDIFNGKNIIVKFVWDKTIPDKPVWSQAFSSDNGKTWEWNWYMYQERVTVTVPAAIAPIQTNTIKVIELRNYVLKAGMRDKFIEYFQDHFVTSQEVLGGHILNMHTVKGFNDNFLWIRGFSDMATRAKFLPALYYGPVWKAFGGGANAMLANNDNVHLLKPLMINGKSIDITTGIPLETFKTFTGITVVNFYVANKKKDKLLDLFVRKYVPIMKAAGITNTTFWVSEMEKNDFPRLPVFQDDNVVVTMTQYDNEAVYESKMKQVQSMLGNELKDELMDTITTSEVLILYPAKSK